jgi:alkylated DNA repair dioxygenase AlkB
MSLKRKTADKEDDEDGKPKLNYLTKDHKSWLRIFPSLPATLDTKTVLDDLWGLCSFEETFGLLFGKKYKTPRYHQTYSDEVSNYRFSGVDHKSIPLPGLLKPFMDFANGLDEGFKFNMCFVNWYHSGNDYISLHSDDEEQIYRDKKGRINILSISIGETRRFVLKPNDDKKGFNQEVSLEHGSVILMGGLTQSTHKHTVPKVNGKKGNSMGRRVNITFRRFK